MFKFVKLITKKTDFKCESKTDASSKPYFQLQLNIVIGKQQHFVYVVDQTTLFKIRKF